MALAKEIIMLLVSPSFPWASLPIELQIEVLKNFIDPLDFPQTLFHFSVTSSASHNLANDRSLFHHAIEQFFPACKQNFLDAYQKTPQELFKTVFTLLNSELKKEALSIADYFKTLAHQSNVNSDKKNVLQGLHFALGHPLDPTLWTAQVKENALLFASKLGSTQQVTSLLNDTEMPFSQTTLLSALDLAIEHKHTSVSMALLMKVTPLLADEAARRIFLSAAHQGLFSLISYLLEHKSLALNPAIKREALIAGAIHGHTETARFLLEKCFYQMNSPTLQKGFKDAATNGHEKILSLFLQKIRFSISTNTLLETIEAALLSGQEAIVISLISHANANISSQMRARLLTDAARYNRLTVATFLLENESATLSRLTKGNALKLAASGNHPMMVKLLLQKARYDISTPDKKAILNTQGFKATGLTKEDLLATQPKENEINELTTALTQLHVLEESPMQLDSKVSYTPTFTNQCKGSAVWTTENTPTTKLDTFSKVLSI